MAKKAKPTLKQIEAYRLVYLYDCTHQEAAIIMDCGRSSVTRLLNRLKKHQPQLFNDKSSKACMFSLNEQFDSEPIRKF